jgi:hypothetical protein
LHPIVKSRTIIGRSHDADITVDDTGISRKHVEILWDAPEPRSTTSAPPTGRNSTAPVHKRHSPRFGHHHRKGARIVFHRCSPNQRRLTSSPIPVPTTVSAAVNE